jgi:hypothetical protein
MGGRRPRIILVKDESGDTCLQIPTTSCVDGNITTLSY